MTPASLGRTRKEGRRQVPPTPDPPHVTTLTTAVRCSRSRCPQGRPRPCTGRWQAAQQRGSAPRSCTPTNSPASRSGRRSPPGRTGSGRTMCPGQGTPSADKPLALSMDTLEYDDQGRAVLSGRATPGATVQIYAGNQPLATATANGQSSDRYRHTTRPRRTAEVGGSGSPELRIIIGWRPSRRSCRACRRT